MKINGVTLDSDFGFGKENNVFGCLAEAVILALDSGNKLKSNVGEVDFENFNAFLEFCDSQNIEAGEFKCGNRLITHNELREIMGIVNQMGVGK